MYKLGTTRFNSMTWDENHRYRVGKQDQGCIYCTPKKITEDLTLLLPIFVLEMQNDTNKIMGIGLIRNAINTGKRHNIYSDQFYNRYTYKGSSRIDIKDIDLESEDKLDQFKKLEKRLFTTKSHLKRGQGISEIPYDVRKEYLLFIFD